MTYEELRRLYLVIAYHIQVTPSYVVYYQELLDLHQRIDDAIFTIENEARSGLRFDAQIE